MVGYNKIAVIPADPMHAIMVPLEFIIKESIAKASAAEQSAHPSQVNPDVVSQVSNQRNEQLQMQGPIKLSKGYVMQGVQNAKSSLLNPALVREGAYHNIALMRRVGVQVSQEVKAEIDDALQTYSQIAKATKRLEKTNNYPVFIQDLDMISIYANKAMQDNLFAMKKELSALSKAKDPQEFFSKKDEYVAAGIKQFSDDFAGFMKSAGKNIPRYSMAEQAAINIAGEDAVERIARAKLKRPVQRTLSDKIFDTYKIAMRENSPFTKEVLKGTPELAKENLSQAEIYHLNNRIASLSIEIQEKKKQEKQELKAKRGKEFKQGLESLVGFDSECADGDGICNEYKDRNIALLSLAVKGDLANYAVPRKDVKRAVKKYSTGADLQKKFFGIDSEYEPSIFQDLDLHEFVYDKRVNQKMKLKEVIASVEDKLIDYLSNNLNFSKSLTDSERKEAVKAILPKGKKIVSESTIRRMIKEYEVKLADSNPVLHDAMLAKLTEGIPGIIPGMAMNIPRKELRAKVLQD